MADENIKVVVTGMGAITAQGKDLDEFWEGVREGRVAIKPVEHMPMEGYRTQLGGEVKEEVPPEHGYLNPGGFHDRAIDFTMKAAEEAMERCGVGVGAVPPERWGIVIGTCNAGLLAAEEWLRERNAGEEPDPRLVLLMPPQAFSEALAGAFGIKGPVLSIDTACAASANAIGYAWELIRSGQADAVLTGGADAFSDILYAGFHSLESLSPKPAAPYSVDREGLSLGEGSGMLVLMSEEAAEANGAKPLARVLGYGLSADGYHPTAPQPEGKGAARAIQSAIKQAGIDAEDIDYVNSHGTGTPKNDTAETAATKRGLGENVAYKTAVSSTKSMIGHLLGGAGAIEGITTVKAIQEQVAPPTANFTEPDPECDLDYTPNQSKEREIDVALSNNFAFGGANSAVIYARPERELAPSRRELDRAVVTGLAALTPAGVGIEALWQAFAEGRDCTTSEDGVQVGRVELNVRDFLTPKEGKRVDRLGVFSIISTRLALEDAGITPDEDNKNRIGAIIGTGVGPMESMEGFGAPVMEEGPAGANPAIFPNTVYNAAGGQVALKVGIVGPTSTVTAGHAAGASSLVYGADLVATDHADVIVGIGVDTLTESTIAAYQGLGVLASGSPGADGNGFALSEAGIAILVERAGLASGRGAKPYGEVLGYAITSDGTGIGRIAPDGEGLERAMRVALERAGVDTGDVAAVWANRCGLTAADAAEDAAIERLFGGNGPPVMAPKLLLGEPMGAGASLGAALALQGWRAGDDKSPRGPVIVNSMSLGGTNFSIVLAPSEG